jgi:arylsulfatase A-like enzyme
MLFDYLRENDLYDDMLIIVTSDHGEVFGEWRIVGHDKALYEPLMRAVMVVRKPGQSAGAVNTDFVSSVDIPAFVLRSLPEEIAARYKDRFPYEPGNHPIMGERHFAIEHELRNPVWGSGFDGSAYMWMEWPWKLIHAPGGAHELYNLETDPNELDNAYARETARAEAMATALHTWRDPLVRDLSGEAAPIADPEATEAMEALGYL